MQKMDTRDRQVYGATPARFPILSECPKCKRNQAQWYAHDALLRLLNRDYPVEGYCAICDEFWSISAGERTGLSKALRWTGCRPAIVERSAVNSAAMPAVGAEVLGKANPG